MKPLFVACYGKTNKDIACYHEVDSYCECECHLTKRRDSQLTTQKEFIKHLKWCMPCFSAIRRHITEGDKGQL